MQRVQKWTQFISSSLNALNKSLSVGVNQDQVVRAVTPNRCVTKTRKLATYPRIYTVHSAKNRRTVGRDNQRRPQPPEAPM